MKTTSEFRLRALRALKRPLQAKELVEKQGKPLAGARGSESALRVYSGLQSRDREGAVIARGFSATSKACSTFLVMLLAIPGFSQKKEAPHAVLAGTVFRDPGFALPGATVTLSRKQAPDKKLQQATSDTRGEFAFRVPPGPATYFLTAALKGFKSDRQEFQVYGEEQVNATLLLVPESK